jgi:hypothetical protein
VATLDATTAAEYAAEVNASDRAQVIVDALADPVTVNVYNASDVVVGSGTMAAPWATVSSYSVAPGTLDDFFVTTSDVPNDDWRLKFESGARAVSLTFGVTGSGAEAIWGDASFSIGTRAGISASAIIASGNRNPVWSGAPSTRSYVEGVGGTYDFSQHASDPDGDVLTYSLVGTTYTGISIGSTTGILTVSSSAVAATRALTIRATDQNGLYADTAVSVGIFASTGRSVWFTGAFESGQIMDYTGQTDGFYFGTLPEPQTGSTAYFTSTGGAGPATALDTKVVASETWGSDSIIPRDGSYFLRSAIYRTKNYTDTRFSSGADRPRSVFYMTHVSNLLDWDTEAWFGMSVWLPSNMEHDTATKNEAAEVQLLVVNPNWPSSTHLDFKYYVGGTDTISRWALRYYVGATSTSEATASSTTVSLGLVTADMGRWTDWIFRVRFNPFTSATNPSSIGIPNAKNQTYQGNRGILEVWKNGTKVFSRMNQPLGLVPWTTRDLSFLPRLYKSNWKLFPTSVVGPVYVGFDSIRYGQVTRDGTGYMDVNPAGTSPVSGQEPG